MRVLYMKDSRAPDGFSMADRRTWRTVIFQNILQSIRQIVDAMNEFDIDLEDNNNFVSPDNRRGAHDFSPTAISSSRE
jgi:hypothetical protein